MSACVSTRGSHVSVLETGEDLFISLFIYYVKPFKTGEITNTYQNHRIKTPVRYAGFASCHSNVICLAGAHQSEMSFILTD